MTRRFFEASYVPQLGARESYRRPFQAFRGSRGLHVLLVCELDEALLGGVEV